MERESRTFTPEESKELESIGLDPRILARHVMSIIEDEDDASYEKGYN